VSDAHPTSDQLTTLKSMAQAMIDRTHGVLYRSMAVQPETVLALVECAEAIRMWRSAKSASAENDAYTAATRALSTLEAL